MPYKPKKLSILDILLSLPTDPSGMMRNLLLEQKRPPYLLLAPIATIAILVGPALYHQYSLDIQTAEPDKVRSLWCATGVILSTFIVFATILLRLLALPVTVARVAAATFYSLAGLIPFMVALYLTNFLASGSLTIANYLSTGYHREEDWVVASFTKWAQVAVVFVLFIYANAIRALANSRLLSAIAITLLHFPIMVGAFMVGLTVANAIYPDTGIMDYNFFVRLLFSDRH